MKPEVRLRELLAMTHYSMESGCDAWVEMCKLFPQLEARIGQLEEALRKAYSHVGYVENAFNRYQEVGKERIDIVKLRAPIKRAIAALSQIPASGETVTLMQSKDFWLPIISEWKQAWWAQSDYRERAHGVDANMKHDLARRIAERIRSEAGEGVRE